MNACQAVAAPAWRACPRRLQEYSQVIDRYEKLEEIRKELKVEAAYKAAQEVGAAAVPWCPQPPPPTHIHASVCSPGVPGGRVRGVRGCIGGSRGGRGASRGEGAKEVAA
jgi:hypothetical protein